MPHNELFTYLKDGIMYIFQAKDKYSAKDTILTKSNNRYKIERYNEQKDVFGALIQII